MTAYVLTATSAHECALKSCPKKNEIVAGEKIIKTTGRRSSCGASYAVTLYYHEECYQMRGGRHGK